MAIAPSATYTNAKQEFLNSVINKIGKQTYADQAYSNPLKRFKGEFIDSASDIEEIYVDRAQDTGYDVDGANVMDRAKPTVSVQYHTNEKEHGYKVTVHDKMMRKGFSTTKGISTMADHIIQSMHTGSNIDEYKDVLDTLAALTTAATVNNTVTLTAVTNDTTAKAFVKAVKKMIPKMGEWNSLYSAKPNFAPKDKLMLFIDSDVDVEVQTEYLASLFNMTVGQLNDTTKVSVPFLTDKLGGKIFAVLLDERCLKIHPTYYNVEPTRNGRGKFTNYDLVTNLLLSYTDWFQFVIFTTL